MDTGSFPGVKLSGRGFDHPHLSSVKVKERVQLYIFPSGPSWPVPGGTLPLPLPLTLPGIHLDTKVFCGMTLVSLGDWFPTFRMNAATPFLRENQSQEEDKGATYRLKRREPHSVKHQKNRSVTTPNIARLIYFCNVEAMCFLWISNISCL